MGCQFSKASDEGKNNDGKGKNKKKDVEEPPPPPPPNDPRLPLTVRQKFSISKSWKGINRAIEQTGVIMFLKYVL